jgi:acetate kinase
MGTRSGDVDPGVLLYLLEEKGMDAAALSQLLYHEAGLKGLSGLSQDMRDLEASEQPDAREAIDYFITRVRMAIGALAAALGGLDALVFTAGIGEHSSRVRAGVIEGLDWLGLALDAKANAQHAETISTTTSSVRAFVIPTDEEAMIAHHAIETAGLSRSNGPT